VERINIKSVFVGQFGRRRDDDFRSITMEAAQAILDPEPSRVGHIYLAAYAPTQLCGIDDPLRTIAQDIQSRIPGLRAVYHGMFKTGGEALYTALADLKAGTFGDQDDVIVIGSEKMTHLQHGDAAGRLAGLENDHDARYGATLPALGGLVTHAYLDRYDVPEDALHRVAVKNHRHAASNPKAHFQKAVTIEEVAASPLVADPLRRLHCAPTSDGAAAVRLSHDESTLAYTGWGRGLDRHLLQEREDITRFVATAEAASTALARAGVATDDIDVVEIHDAFSSFELINLEEMGFYEPGTAWRALANGELTINGSLAVNTSGGMKAKGHPIGATGLSQTAEVCAQLARTAGSRQHDGARLGMVQSAGGVSKESYVFVIEGEEPS
jgi:acetyl-CoA acetyltransferase